MRLFWKAFAVGGAGLVLAGPMTALPSSDAGAPLRLERLFSGVCGPGRGGSALTRSLLVASAVAALRAHEVLAETRALAVGWARAAIAELDPLPAGPVKDALVSFAQALADRAA